MDDGKKKKSLRCHKEVAEEDTFVIRISQLVSQPASRKPAS